MTSAARDLMDTGTPGPWRFTDSETVYDVDQAGLTIVSGERDPIANVADEWYEPEGQDEDATPFHDARKIVLSVNALPLVDALCEAISDRLRREPDCPTCARVMAARDALEAALRGEGDA